MAFVRSVARSFKLAGYFFIYSVELIVKRPATREARADWLHRFCARVLKGMGITTTVIGKPPERGALISNHLGYVDIVLYAGLHPCVFCSKAEIAKWPVLGWMAKMSGTVFVERGAGGSAQKAKEGMKAAVDTGLPITFFPEGTTTNGKELLPFKSGLLYQVLAADAPVTAAFVTYTFTQDNGPGITVEDNLNYWGETPILGHIFRFVALKGVHAEVRFAPHPIQFVADLDHRKEAANEAREAVRALAAEAGLDFPPVSVEIPTA
ncbi:lyso-ornithine lipid acyltransferase [Granulicella rosea]|uniref:Lyso-ornithine lipid acyltransferase n=1 Tax=Granulicella rosea TaxID=474952 RepID=A0A239DWN4_9BACT|nr:lysophospholipid acyltransferase family protein [Granulicella rosea]SNS36767.1 lyso-ornithine lipid acyltransferase [Granulicella rosea]